VLAHERQARIAALVGERGVATVSDLAAELGASESTIRRDLDRLAHDRRLVKVHGGAMALERAHLTRDLTLPDRYGLHAGEKDAICRLAATLVGPDDFVYLDAGSTVEALASLLAPTRAAFATNSVSTAFVLAAKGLRVIVLGGELVDATKALSGPDTTEAIARYNFTLGFWGTNGVTAEAGFTVQDRGEAAVKSAALARCARPYVLADASKLGKRSLITYAPLEAATLVTAGDVPAQWRGREGVVVADAAGIGDNGPVEDGEPGR
jgi:DeoR family fructose operon transcriptional repressor